MSQNAYRAWSKTGWLTPDGEPGYVLAKPNGDYFDITGHICFDSMWHSDEFIKEQATGREDIHGNMIWEGSVVRGLNINGYHVVKWSDYHCCFRLDTGMYLWELEKLVIEGNIIENADLLET